MAGVVALAVLGAPAALAGVAPGALGAACASAASIHAGLVVDFGDVAALPNRPADTADCVADPGDNGITLLVKRFGKGGIRLNGSGLVCAIDGYPATGCGEKVGDKYRYWSYWKSVWTDDDGREQNATADHAGTTWRYSSIGPRDRSISDGTVDGWHFVEGSASPSDGGPTNSSPAGPCPPPPTSPPSTAAPAGGGQGGSGSTGAVTTTAPVPADPTATSAPADSLADLPTDTAADMTDGDGSTGSTGATGALGATESAAEVAGDAGSGGGGVPLVAIGVGVAVVALAGGAALRFRTRTDE
jgi:hypothetical protein